MSDARQPGTLVLTGASGGIGAALALVYAEPGRSMALIGRNAERLAASAAACEARGAQVTTAQIDVTDAEALRTWLRDFDRQSPVEILIANAGISGGRGPDGRLEDQATATRQLRVNLEGAVNTVHALLEPMHRRKRGRIVLMSSLSALRALPDAPAYSASKAGLLAYGDALRGTLRRKGISVTVICPGFVTSPMSARYLGPRPGELPADRAAALMRRGIDRGRAHVVFPAHLGLAMRASHFLPATLSDAIMRRFGFRIAPEE
ncbi:SDR family NAD(P)-dependent oxidoreductase [Aquibaculum sediminis]|uniref:SDR family NAD(P)-dependent oxidoreductase n=1 Tax=Aquibaculum sediminis TaxID=3231907 RepID=UPI0034563512